VEDALRQSIQKYGIPEAVYFDYTEKNTLPNNLLNLT
jgi:hypothetical protein